MKMQLSEAFYSIQGEGPTSGCPALFIRFSKCNLRCVWCDTQEVMKQTHEVDIEKLLHLSFDRVVFTGGEPMLYQEEVALIIGRIKELYPNKDIAFEIETNGTVPIHYPFLALHADFNISPKLDNSGMSARARKLHSDYMGLRASQVCFKFVVGHPQDVDILMQEFPGVFEVFRDRVYLMPLGASRAQLEESAPMVAEQCIKHQLKFSNRQHIILWNTQKGV